LGNVILKTSNVLRNCFRRWNDIAQKMIDQQNRSRIARYINKRYRVVNARNNWKKLVDKYMLKDKNGNLFDFIKKLKKYVVLNRLKKPLTYLAKRHFFEKLKKDK
jgi:predicted patatin/cPLA2 family phospholipase